MTLRRQQDRGRPVTVRLKMVSVDKSVSKSFPFPPPGWPARFVLCLSNTSFKVELWSVPKADDFVQQ